MADTALDQALARIAGTPGVTETPTPNLAAPTYSTPLIPGASTSFNVSQRQPAYDPFAAEKAAQANSLAILQAQNDALAQELGIGTPTTTTAITPTQAAANARNAISARNYFDARAASTAPVAPAPLPAAPVTSTAPVQGSTLSAVRQPYSYVATAPTGTTSTATAPVRSASLLPYTPTYTPTYTAAPLYTPTTPSTYGVVPTTSSTYGVALR